MNQEELENWQKVKEALEKANKTDSFFYKRALAICAGKNDPIDQTWTISQEKM
mgnify:CR=1 FL=1